MKAWGWWIVLAVVLVIVAICWGLYEQNKRWREADVLYTLMRTGDEEKINKYIAYLHFK